VLLPFFFFAGVAPFSGATTGTGGRIRDVQCTGRGAHVVAGTAGYCFGNLHIPGSIFFFPTHQVPFQVLCPDRHQHLQLLGVRVTWVSFLRRESFRVATVLTVNTHNRRGEVGSCQPGLSLETSIHLERKHEGWRDGSVVRALTALPEVPSSNPNNHMVAHNHL
jgi:hypothetical protein